MRTIIAATLCIGAATHAAAQDADLSPGASIMFHMQWDRDALRLVPGAPPGSETACFEVGERTEDGQILLTLTSGAHYQTWSEETVTEYETYWFSSYAYMQANPDADSLEQIRRQFRNVEGC